MKEEIYRCDNCGKIIPQNRVIAFMDSAYVLLLCDYHSEKPCRPTLPLRGITLCLDCLVPYFQKWVTKIKNDAGYIF